MKVHRPAILLAALLMFSVPVFAKDLTHRISVGYNNQLNYSWIGENADTTTVFANASSVSSKYWLTEDLGFEGLFGYKTLKNREIGGWSAKLGCKVLYNLNKEDNLNFYAGGGLSLLPSKIDYGRDEDSFTGVELAGFVGTEFFLQGLPNLGFDVEVGLQYMDIDRYAEFSTYGGGFGLFGIRYYF